MKLRRTLTIIKLAVFIVTIINISAKAQDQKTLAEKSKASINSGIAAVQRKYAPDRRTAIFEIQAKTNKKGQQLLYGRTNLPLAKEFLLQQFAEMKIKMADSIEILPAKRLGSEIYGIVNLSVANIRSQPAHSAELATQALLGMPVNVLDERDGWYLIQTPDDYISWVDDWGIKRVSKEKLNEWLSANKIIYINPYGFSYSGPDNHSQTISDLVAGDVLRMDGTEGNFIRAIYPDGRKAYISKEEVKVYDQWLSEANPTPENIIKTGKTLTGVPYLWGGTSYKGVDCSGFTKTVFFLNGLIIQRDASQQVNSGELINTDKSYDELKPGDLLFFGRRAREGNSERVSHVAIYLGDLQYINASGMVRTGRFQSAKPDYMEYRAFSLIRGKRYIGHTGEKGITRIQDSPYYKIH